MHRQAGCPAGPLAAPAGPRPCRRPCRPHPSRVPASNPIVPFLTIPFPTIPFPTIPFQPLPSCQVFFAIFLGAMGAAQAQLFFPDVAKGKAATQRVFTIIDRVPAIDASSQVRAPRRHLLDGL